MAKDKDEAKPHGGKADKPEKAQKKAPKPEKGAEAAGEAKGKKGEKADRGPIPVPRLQTKYVTEIVPALMAKFGLTNRMAIPRLDKIVVSMGVGKAIENKKRLEAAQKDMGVITGQRPVTTLAKQSISGFKLRQGMPIGCQVTLRRQRMYEFLDRLISIVIPRIRDFRGLSPKSFDGRGNYNFGLNEQVVFPEINIDTVEFVQGMNVTFAITGGSDVMSHELMTQFGMPFRQ